MELNNRLCKHKIKRVEIRVVTVVMECTKCGDNVEYPMCAVADCQSGAFGGPLCGNHSRSVEHKETR